MKNLICLGLESTAHTFGVGIIDEKGNILADTRDMYTTESGGIIPTECAKHHLNLKEKLGVYWGDKTYTPGGKSLKFFSSVRLAVSKGEKIKGKNDEQIGSIIKIVAQKNKVAPPWRKGEFTLFYATGVDHEADCLDTAEELKVIKKEGNTYMFGEEKLGVGRDRAIESLKLNKELYEKIYKATQEAVKKEG